MTKISNYDKTSTMVIQYNKHYERVTVIDFSD